MLRSVPWLVAACLILLVLAKFDSATGFTALLRFGEIGAERRLPAVQALAPASVPGSAGYDGQFYAQLALDPTLRDPALATALDSPAYRARRILLPAAAHVLGLGHPAAILQIYALLNLACWGAFAALLWRQLAPIDATGLARWLGAVLSLGVLDSIRLSLVDLPALLLLVLAVRAHTAPARGTFWLALGHLTKETNLLATAALHATREACTPRRLGWLALSAVPLALWFAWVATRFSGPSAHAGLGNFSGPLFGAAGQFATSVRAVLAGDFDTRHTFALAALVGLHLQFAVLLSHRTPCNPWWRIGVAYGALLLFLGPWVWSGYWAACRAVLPLTLAFNLMLPAGRSFWPLWVAGNLTLVHGVWRWL